MTGLLYNELKLNWKKLLGFFPVVIAYPVMIVIVMLTTKDDILDDSGTGLDYLMLGLGAFIAFLIGGAFEDSLFKEGERKKWAYFVTSTPTGVKGQMGAKYLLTMIFSMLTVTVLVLCNGLAMESDMEVHDFSVIYVLFFYVQLLMRAVEYPLMTRFGSKTGKDVKILLIGVISLILFIYALFGDTSEFSDMSNFWEKLFKIFGDPEKTKKIMLWFSIGAVAILPIYYLSYRLAVKWYLKGVEHYAK
ncbi:MAG: ABC-2 transporter permease [Ruminococcus sp.]|uniref:ABC-2 transporter permease n=1 Tax=Ruminococcus sp. TaxID=41978 RepID=UPI0025CFFBF2|nr:ABC-2 transporter permease [Ruminococcus sp.]MCR5600788.1 ABC-2 transporter permease [Ruminococcus sp.]